MCDSIVANAQNDHVSLKQFVQVMWSFSHLRFAPPPEVIDMFEVRLRACNIKQYADSDVSNAIFSLAKLGGADQDSIGKLEEELIARLPAHGAPPPFTPDEMAEAMWGLAVLGKRTTLAALAASFAREVAGHGGAAVLHSMRPRQLMGVVWSLGALEGEDVGASSRPRRACAILEFCCTIGRQPTPCAFART